MSRETKTQYWCDFNGITAAHPAEFEVSTDLQTTNLPGDHGSFDACGKHLIQMLQDAYNRGVKQCKVTALVASPKIIITTRTKLARTAKPIGGGNGIPDDHEYICDHTGCDRTFGSAQAVAMHKFRMHGTRKAV